MTIEEVNKWRTETEAGGEQTMPAAPPPTMTTFFLPSLTKPSEDILWALRVCLHSCRNLTYVEEASGSYTRKGRATW